MLKAGASYYTDEGNIIYVSNPVDFGEGLLYLGTLFFINDQNFCPVLITAQGIVLNSEEQIINEVVN